MGTQLEKIITGLTIMDVIQYGTMHAVGNTVEMKIKITQFKIEPNNNISLYAK